METVRRNDSSFRQAFDEHYRDVLAYARRRSGPSDAEDVAAETFAIAWRRWPDAPPAAIRPWLFGIARRVLANTHRSVRRRGRLYARLRSMRTDEPDLGEEHAEVAEALDRLRPSDREIIRLHCWEDLAASEIGVVLGCSPNAASIRLHRARQRFVRSLTELSEAPR